jgi:FlaA1/EpsC-like NDP-sugar epimerase
MYSYYYYVNRNKKQKTKKVIIYGAGKAGIKLEEEFRNSEYKVRYFVDDDKIVQGRSIDAIRILSKEQLKQKMQDKKYDLLVIAIPSSPKTVINKIYGELKEYFDEVKILPSLSDILQNQNFTKQLKDISVEDLLARHPQDLDKTAIESFIKNKKVLITGAGGSIGSEISRQCLKFGAKQLILLDHSEYNLYTIEQELSSDKVIPVMQSVTNLEALEKTFAKYTPDIVIHAAAYKHVPLVEHNIQEGIVNNIIGTKNCIDLAIKYGVKKFILISTDKAVRPTNVMGTTKRICELYAQNSNGNGTDIVAVRFGNVLGSSGSVIPKFKSQIENGQNLTVTHPDITRYFMLIPEACELVLQAGAIGTGGEIFILDMGEPVKIVDLAKKMIELSGRDEIDIEFTGLRPGEKLYEELLIDDTDCTTDYKSITVAKPTPYDIDRLNEDINKLLVSKDKILHLKRIVPEFNHQLN